MKKMLLGSLLVLAACSPFYPAEAHEEENHLLIGRNVIVHLDNNAQFIAGVLVSNDGNRVMIRLSNGKLYMYPLHRVSGVEEL